ncbi:hypothetical protein QZH41_010463 [Actinostola sp. cb2023]|nr:hypothetical protein QZH41_010463 [Actinostola sp. cb2023]
MVKRSTCEYFKLHLILNKTSILNDIKKLSSDAQTSCLEGFHSTLNQWHPKMICFSWLGTHCRMTQVSKDGKRYINVTYPKYKMGEEVVRDIAVKPTYGYVENMKKLLFSLTRDTLNKIMSEYKTKVPGPLNSKFPQRRSKDEAMVRYNKRKETIVTLVPTAKQQDKLLQN